jgi:colanic acid biosynthesis glycosyl transferase WcaI
MHARRFENMRILILHMRYWPDATGTAPLVTELARDLAAKGEDVTVVTSAPHYQRSSIPEEYRGQLVHRSLEEGVRVLRTWAYVPPAGSVVGRGIDYIAFTLLSTIVAASAGRQDVILCIAPPITVGISGWLVGLLRRSPIVFNAQDIWPDGLVSMGRLKSRGAIAAFHALERFIYRRAMRVTVVSDGMRRNLLEKGVPVEKVRVISNWVDLSAVRPVEKINAFRAELGLEDKFVVLFAGNLGYAAALETVIEAAKILKYHQEIIFLIVGEGSAKADLVSRCEMLGLENVRFVTTQPKDRIGEVYGSADLSLVTLRSDMGSLSVPSKAYTIMASQRAMLAAVPEDSEIARIVTEVDCGRWVSPEDPQALADAILACHQESDTLAIAGKNGRMYVEQYFERSILTGQYHRLLREVAQGKEGAES